MSRSESSAAAASAVERACRRRGRGRRGRPASRRRVQNRPASARDRLDLPAVVGRPCRAGRTGRRSGSRTAFASAGRVPGSRPIRVMAAAQSALPVRPRRPADDAAASSRAGRSPLRASRSSLSRSRAFDSLATASITSWARSIRSASGRRRAGGAARRARRGRRASSRRCSRTLLLAAGDGLGLLADRAGQGGERRPPCATRRASRAGCRGGRSRADRQSADQRPGISSQPRRGTARAGRGGRPGRRRGGRVRRRGGRGRRPAWPRGGGGRRPRRRRGRRVSKGGRARASQPVLSDAPRPRRGRRRAAARASSVGTSPSSRSCSISSAFVCASASASSTRRRRSSPSAVGRVELGLEPFQGLGRGDGQGLQRVERARPEAERLQGDVGLPAVARQGVAVGAEQGVEVALRLGLLDRLAQRAGVAPGPSAASLAATAWSFASCDWRAFAASSRAWRRAWRSLARSWTAARSGALRRRGSRRSEAARLEVGGVAAEVAEDRPGLGLEPRGLGFEPVALVAGPSAGRRAGGEAPGSRRPVRAAGAGTSSAFELRGQLADLRLGLGQRTARWGRSATRRRGGGR